MNRMDRKLNIIKKLTFVFFFLSIRLTFSQEGIGTNSPNEQAVLEIQSVDKGVLFPSISLTSTTTFLGGISATASHTNMLVYNTNTATTPTGLDGTGYYFWNGSNWEKITGDTDDQSLAEVTAIGNTTNDVIAVGGVLDSGALTVVGDADLQGNVDLGDTYLDNVSILGTINTDLLFQAGKNVASPTSALVAVYSSELKPGSGDDLSIDTNSTSERINFSNNGVITAGVNSSTLFVGDISGPNHYKLPSGTASRASGQVLTVDSSTENLYFSTIPTLPASFDDGATLRWNLSATEWEATTDFRIAPGTGYSLPNAIWIEESIIPSSTINLGQSGNSFVEVYADQFISSQGSVTFGTSNGSAKVNLKFDGDPSGSLVLNDRNAIAGQNNTAFGYQTFNTAGSTGNNNVAIGHGAISGSSGTGGNNVAIGFSALADNSADDNVAIGYTALTLNSGGTQNVAVGSQALDENTTGQYNTAVGYNALNANTSGENNIAIGKAAMAANITGQKNVVIGTDADLGASDLENAIAIGFSATVNASNTIQLGNSDITRVTTAGVVSSTGYIDSSLGDANEILIVGTDDRIISTDVLTIDDINKRVGVGTTSPERTFDLVGEAAYTADVQVRQYNSGGDGPGVRLQKGRGSLSSPSAVNDGDTLGGLEFFGYIGSGMQQSARISSEATIDGSNLGADLRFATRGTSDSTAEERFRIAQNGNIGVGTTVPTETFHIVGESDQAMVMRLEQNNNGTDAPDIKFYRSRGTNSSPLAVGSSDNLGFINMFAHDGTDYVHSGAAGWVSTDTDGDSSYRIQTRVSGTRAERLNITSTGDTQINGKLILNDTNSSSTQYTLVESEVADSDLPTLKIEAFDDSSTWSEETIHINNEGAVHTFVWSDDLLPYHVAGSAGEDLGNSSYRWTGIWAQDINYNGTLTNASDSRLKNQIVPIEEALILVNGLQPSSYNKYTNTQKTGKFRKEYGLIAQEVKKIIPLLVSEENTEEKLLSVNYIGLIPILIKAIQELNEQLNQQSLYNNKLEHKIESQEKQTNELKGLFKRIELLEGKVNNND